MQARLTSTTFISNISQTNGVISATKKKLPTFAGSSQSGIVSVAEGYSEECYLSASGNWIYIDDSLDPDSTSPVQNKTLYNLETYHTLNFSDNAKTYIIDDGSFAFEIGTSIKLFFNKNLQKSTSANSEYLKIHASKSGQPKKVWTTSELSLSITNTADYQEQYKKTQSENFLRYHRVYSGYDGAAGATYEEVFFKKGTAIELILTPFNGECGWAIIGDPIVGRYKYSYKYLSAPGWNITANAIVYASGLKIQWGNFTNHSAKDDESAQQETYFPVLFEETPSMSVTFNANSDHALYYRDMPCAVSNAKWKLYADASNNQGTWQAIGY